MTSTLRVIFMGTPEYALPSLNVLGSSPLVDLALVVTQPDRPQGRGRKLQSPPVRVAADALNIPVLQVSSLRDPEIRSRLSAVEPDLIVVAAFGVILGARTLELPKFGCVNLHASILPKYRGANPIAAAIAMGESKTGVTLMQMDRGLDTGPILAMSSLEIAAEDTTAVLTNRLAQLGADLLVEHLPALIEGTLEPQVQPLGATLTRPMTKDDGWIDWSGQARMIANHVRAMIPWPHAWTTLPDGSRVQLLEVDFASRRSEHDITGRLEVRRSSVEVTAGEGVVRIKAGQLPGGKPMEGRSLADRLRSFDGEILAVVDPPAARTPLVVPVP